MGSAPGRSVSAVDDPSRTGMGSKSQTVTMTTRSVTRSEGSIAPASRSGVTRTKSKFSVSNAAHAVSKSRTPSRSRTVSRQPKAKKSTMKLNTSRAARNNLEAPRTYVPKRRDVSSSVLAKSNSVSQSYLSKMKSGSKSMSVTPSGTMGMVRAVKYERRAPPSVSDRTIAIEDLSANRLFKVANKAQDKAVEAMMADYNAKVKALAARAEAAEMRADREYQRAESTQTQLDDALARATRAEVRANELSDIPVKEVLQFIIKNSNTAQKKMGEEVRPTN